MLGGGGVVGQAYHAGVLTALENDLRWDPRTADVIVGTSAGAIVATLLRSGVAASELAAWAVQAPQNVQSEMLLKLFGEDLPQLDPVRMKDLLRPPSMPSVALLRGALMRPWKFHASAALMTLLGPGNFDIAEHLAALRQVEGTRWPDDLWITAVRRADGRRVVFGRPGGPPAPLHLAVAASCAVPGYFAPVPIGGRAYIDGGVHSLTNAALLADRDLDLDLVIIVSPMSGPGPPTDIGALMRRHAGRRLARELRALRAAGIAVVVFEPGRAVQELMGLDFLSSDRVHDIVRESFLAAGTHAARSSVRSLLTIARTGREGTATAI